MILSMIMPVGKNEHTQNQHQGTQHIERNGSPTPMHTNTPKQAESGDRNRCNDKALFQRLVQEKTESQNRQHRQKDGECNAMHGTDHRCGSSNDVNSTVYAFV